MPSAHTPRIPIVVVGHADCWTEVYAPPEVDARFAVVAATQSDAAAALAQQYARDCLPWRYRQVWAPEHLRGADLMRPVRVMDLVTREADLAYSATLDTIATRMRAIKEVAA